MFGYYSNKCLLAIQDHGASECADKWQMKIAFNKCTVHRISNRDSHINQNPEYTIGGQSNETRDLGIIIDNKLNFNSHVSAVAHKAHVCTCLFNTTNICF